MIDPAEIMVGTMYGPLRPLRVCKDQIIGLIITKNVGFSIVLNFINIK